MPDTAELSHAIAEALEAAAPNGIAVGEDERAVIAAAIDGFRQGHIDELLAEMDAWRLGNKSYTNFYVPHQNDLVAWLDAMEVVKLSAAVQAYAALLPTTKD